MARIATDTLISDVVCACAKGRGVGTPEQRHAFAKLLLASDEIPGITETLLNGLTRQTRRRELQTLRESAQKAAVALLEFELRLDNGSRAVQEIHDAAASSAGLKRAALDDLRPVREYLDAVVNMAAEMKETIPNKWNPQRNLLDIAIAETVAETYHRCFGKWPGTSRGARNAKTPFAAVCQIVEKVLNDTVQPPGILTVSLSTTVQAHGVRNARALAEHSAKSEELPAGGA